jgi:hypothetical protein
MNTACDGTGGGVENVLRAGACARDFVTRNEMSDAGDSHEKS